MTRTARSSTPYTARNAAAPRADAVAAPKDEADDAPIGGGAPDDINELVRAVDCDLGLLELELKAGARARTRASACLRSSRPQPRAAPSSTQ